jgi:hypothetical protein
MLTSANLPKSIATLFVLLLAGQLFAPMLQAQQGQSSTQDQSPKDRTRLLFEARLSQVVKSMTERSNAENAELNARIATMNANDPLAMRNLDSVHVAANVSRVLEFIDFLKHARAMSDTLAREYEDSLYILSVKLPPDINSHGIQDMDAAFRMDRDAFNAFLDDMVQTYSDVLDVLIYLQHTPYSLTNKEFTFTEKKDMKEYQKRMKLVDADTKELKKANDDMQKANADANKLTQNPGDALDGN